METKIYSVDEIKNLFLQELLNKVDGKISKVSNNSVLNGVAYGFSKVFQKSMKDVALLESEMFPEYAYGEYLDKVAMRYGIAQRRSYSGSSVFVKLVATSGSVYDADSCAFTSTDGVSFVLEDDVTIGTNGWTYAKLKSVGVGAKTNVSANTILNVSGQPSGHKFVTNDLAATGGVDVESDADFLQRILQNFNNFSFETLDKLTYVFQLVNPNVLLVKKLGSNTLGQIGLGVASVNGVAFTSSELSLMAEKGQDYLSLSDVFSVNQLPGALSSLLVQNMDSTYLDMDFRVDLDSDVDIDDFRVELQGKITDYLDFTQKDIEKIEWEDVYAIVRNMSGVRVLSEEYFYCGNNTQWSSISKHFDLDVPKTTIPRLRMFVVRDLNNNVLTNNNSEIVSYYYGSDYVNLFNQINTI